MFGMSSVPHAAFQYLEELDYPQSERNSGKIHKKALQRWLRKREPTVHNSLYLQRYGSTTTVVNWRKIRSIFVTNKDLWAAQSAASVNQTKQRTVAKLALSKGEIGK